MPYYFIMVFTVILFTSTSNFAQGPGPCMTPPCSPPNPPGLAPIDGGVVFLLLSGLLLGVNSLRKKED